MTGIPGTVLNADALRLDAAGDALDLAVGAGSITAIVGPANSGKSAWLQLLAALRMPASGRLRLLGKDVEPASAAALRPRIGFVSGNAPLLSNFNARTNVMLPRLYHSHESPAIAEQRANALLDQTGFAGARDALPSRLNRFERLQVQIARALAMDPALLFIDEPFSLDWATAWSDIDAMLASNFGSEERALVVVTHNMQFVSRHAAQVVFVNGASVCTHPDWSAIATSTDPALVEYLHALPIQRESGAP